MVIGLLTGSVNSLLPVPGTSKGSAKLISASRFPLAPAVTRTETSASNDTVVWTASSSQRPADDFGTLLTFDQGQRSNKRTPFFSMQPTAPYSKNAAALYASDPAGSINEHVLNLYV